MHCFAERCKCEHCEVYNHIFINFDLAYKGNDEMFRGIEVNYSIDMSVQNGKVVKLFKYGFKCEWCEKYNSRETVYRGLKV